MIRTIACLTALTALAVATRVEAATPPAQLLNKTVVVSFSVAWPGNPGTLAIQRLIYVSTKGRIFARGTRSTGNAADTNDVSPGNYRYEGGRIVGVTKLESGANQITISFDPAFTSCTAALQFGRPSGESYRHRVPTGATVASNSTPTASGVSCAIRDGNPF